jgi:histidine triad (HIT) family protein
MDEVELHRIVHTEPSDASGILRNLRLVQDDMEHGRSLMSECLFCKIARKEIPSAIVYEDDTLLAFKDIFPQAPVHLLIIPKAHCDGLTDLTPDTAAAAALIPQLAARLAADQGLTGGWRLISNCGADGGQSVFHLHFHLLGGKPLGPKLCQ